MENSKYQTSWKEVFIDKKDPALYTKKLGLSEEVISLYQGFVRNHFISSIEKMFPRLNDLVDWDWNEISDLYFKEYPSSDWDLNELTRSFPLFLKTHKESLKIEDYLIELSEYELMEFFVYTSNAKDNISTLKYKLNPTASFKIFNYQIANWVKAMDQFESQNQMDLLKKSQPELGQNILFVHRDSKSKLCVFTQIDAVMGLIIEVIQNYEVFNTSELVEITQQFKRENEDIEFDINYEALETRIDFLKKQGLIYI